MRKTRKERERAARRVYAAMFASLVMLLAAGFGVGRLVAYAMEPEEPAEDPAPVVVYVEQPAPDPQPEPAEAVDPVQSLGEFKVTHYCACPICCGKWADGITATGTTATEGRTIAVDPTVIPLGSTVRVTYGDGTVAEYIAEDAGSAIQGNRLDVFVADHGRAWDLGVRYADVIVLK